MKMLKELILGLYVVSTAALAGQDDVIARLAIERAEVKPDQAMALVEQQYPNSRIVEFSLDDDDDHPQMRYELKVVDPKASQTIELYVDAATGLVTEDERENYGSWFSKEDKHKYQQLMKGTTLQQAVAEAQKVAPGILLEAELESEKGIVYFETEILTNTALEKVVVDLSTGKPIPVVSGQHHG